MRTALSLLHLVSILLDLAQDALQFLLLGTRSSAALKAENIFLRKQLALYLEREAKPRRATGATRLSMVLLSQLFAWQNALINVCLANCYQSRYYRQIAPRKGDASRRILQQSAARHAVMPQIALGGNQDGFAEACPRLLARHCPPHRRRGSLLRALLQSVPAWPGLSERLPRTRRQ